MQKYILIENKKNTDRLAPVEHAISATLDLTNYFC